MKTHQVKLYISVFLVFLLFILSTGSAQAYSFELTNLSMTNNIYGRSWKEDGSGGVIYSYESSSSDTPRAEISTPLVDDDGDGSFHGIERAYVLHESSLSETRTQIAQRSNGTFWAYDEYQYGEVRGYAEAYYSFKLQSDYGRTGYHDLFVTLDSYCNNGVDFVITDSMDNIIYEKHGHVGFEDGYVNFEIGEEYELYLKLNFNEQLDYYIGGMGGSDYLDKDIWIDIDNYEIEIPAPEPATMLLLGSGLIGLAGVRRKFWKTY